MLNLSFNIINLTDIFDESAADKFSKLTKAFPSPSFTLLSIRLLLVCSRFE